ncbi:hypothetical protein AB0D67_23155 [Streptosporangium sp. NPDC048047]|uniref:hypothetical protein n=1 Tax=Streptosporangium sp. NPDC048047 TaxID=3155748 RepID=UPI0034158295
MFKTVLAGVAISTALTGGIVSLGAATTAAGATVAQTTVAGFQTCGGCGGCGWGGRRCSHRRFRLRVITANNNYNTVHGDNAQAQRERQAQTRRDFEFERFNPVIVGGGRDEGAAGGAGAAPTS